MHERKWNVAMVVWNRGVILWAVVNVANNQCEVPCRERLSISQREVKLIS